jgi:hypothetical protein
MRTAHLTIEDIAAYGDRKLSSESALEISDHLSVCRECREIVRRADEQGGLSSATVSYEELTAYLDDRLAPIERHDISEKLNRSPQARRELRDLVEFKEEMAMAERGSGADFPKWVLPLAAGIMIAAVAGWWSLTSRNRDVAGDLSPELRTTLDQTLAQGRFSLPPFMEPLRPSPGQLASQSASARNVLKLISPVGTAVATRVPVFRWSKVADATAYRINLGVRNSDLAIASFEVPGTQTTWTVSEPLTEGQTYQWEVQAIRNGEILEQAPVAPEPEALFYVLNRQEQNDLARAQAKLGHSHLALGLVYARAGLIDDAKEEFRAFQEANPKSDLPKKLRDALGK